MAGDPIAETILQGQPASAGAPMLAPGTLVAGKYQVEEQLGEGGMGVVVKAMHLTLREHVAIKFLKPVGAGDSDAIARFVREARSSAKLKNEHIINVFDVGVHEGMPYLVMELVDGEGLGALVAAGGPLETSLAVDLLLQACDAMADAHALGVVHRDLKPNNLMLTRRGDGSPFVKVLDFGLATAPTDTEPGGAVGITSTQATFGSPAYMPPEQIRSARDADARSDIWALGVILYELVSGRIPFEGNSAMGVLAAISADPPTPLTVYRPDLAALWPPIERCLQKDPSARYPDVAGLAAALAPFASVEGALVAARAQRSRKPSSAPAGPAVPTSASGSQRALTRSGSTTSMAPTSAAPPRPTSRRAKRWLVAPVVIALCSTALAFGAWRSWTRRGAIASDGRGSVSAPLPTVDPAAVTTSVALVGPVGSAEPLASASAAGPVASAPANAPAKRRAPRGVRPAPSAPTPPASTPPASTIVEGLPAKASDDDPGQYRQ